MIPLQKYNQKGRGHYYRCAGKGRALASADN